MRADSTNKALMDPGGGIIDSLRPMLYRWNDEFLCRRMLCLDEENRSYLKDDAERSPNEHEDIMTVLSRAYEDSERWAYGMKPLQKLCQGIKLEKLTSTILDREEPVALVFDRDGSGRRSDGPLTVGGLYKVLSVPVS